MKTYTKNRLESQIFEDVCSSIDGRIDELKCDIESYLKIIDEMKAEAADRGEPYEPGWRENEVENWKVQLKYLEDLVEFLSTEYRPRKK